MLKATWLIPVLIPLCLDHVASKVHGLVCEFHGAPNKNSGVCLSAAERECAKLANSEILILLA